MLKRFLDRVESASHPVAIERWHSYLFDKEYSISNFFLIISFMMFSALGYAYSEYGFSIFTLYIAFLVVESIFFLRYYSKNADPDLELKEVLDK